MRRTLTDPPSQGGRIDPTSPDLASRVIIRAACDFLLVASAEGVRNYGTLKRAMLMTAIMVANVQHITRSAVRNWRYASLDQIPPDSERRPVSILSLAQSVDTPFETARANVNALVRDGLCVRTPTGVIVPSDVLQSEKLLASEIVIWEAFQKMVSTLLALDYDFSSVVGEASASSALVIEDYFKGAHSTQSPRRLVSRVIAEFYMNVIVDAHAPHGDDCVIGTVSTAFMVLNSAAWSQTAEAAWRYSRADTPPPDHLRTPASIADAARLTAMGKELVRRKVHDLVAAGRLEQVDRGYLLSMDYMQGPESRAGAAALIRAFYRMIYDLNALGVPM